MNTPAVIEPVKQFGYKVSLSRYCNDSTYENESGEPYCHSWSESWSNSFESIVKTDKYPDLASAHDFKVGERVYVVWAEWSSGDSFGHGDRSSCEAFGLFKFEADAYAFQHALEHAREGDQGQDWNDRHKFVWTSSEGWEYGCGFLPWFGYFESLDNVHVEAVTIGA